MDYNTPALSDTIYIDPDAYEVVWKRVRNEYPVVYRYSLPHHDAACGLEHISLSKYRVVDTHKWMITRLRYGW